MRGENPMFRKLLMVIVMSIPLAGAAASQVAVPVLVVMGILIIFVVSASDARSESKDEKA